MSIECPEGGDILKELATLRDWHIKTAGSRRSSHSRRKQAKHTAHAYLLQAAMAMIVKQDDIIAQNAEPFTDPNRKNKHAR